MSDIDEIFEKSDITLKELEQLAPAIDLIITSARLFASAEKDDPKLSFYTDRLKGAVSLLNDIEENIDNDKLERERKREKSNIYSLDERRADKARETSGD